MLQMDSVIAPQTPPKTKYGRLKLIDPRSNNFRIEELLKETKQPPKQFEIYTPDHFYDQGPHPFCTAFGLLNYFDLPPVTHSRDKGKWKGYPYPVFPGRQIYCEAQNVDPWPGGCGATESSDAYEGTSVTATMQVAKTHKIVSSYHWELKGNLDNINKCLLYLGPVIVGTSWWDGMELTKNITHPQDAIMHVSGQDLGGHCWNLIGYDSRPQRKGWEYTMMNNWSEEWAFGGLAYIGADDLEKLATEDGAEFCISRESK